MVAASPAGPQVQPLADSDNGSATPPDVEAACDLVMKGGITSGVVYPKLIGKLSRKYRFKNIGGTSAGAIAAGACAAAEFGRQNGRHDVFDQLDKLPEELGQAVEPSKRSRLLSLFQPHPDLRPHFAVLLEALNEKPGVAIANMLKRVLAHHLLLTLGLLMVGGALLAPLISPVLAGRNGWTAIGVALAALVVVGAALWHTSGMAVTSPWRTAVVWLAVYVLLMSALAFARGTQVTLPTAWAAASMLLMALFVWILLVAVAIFRFLASLLRGLHRNRYGLCSGRTMDSPSGTESTLPGLTDWLTSYFDELAGLTSRGHALTFGDLWGSTDRTAPRNVNLEVMTSAVSQQMVYSIPFRDGTPYLYYDPEELKDYFPDRVMQWLNDVAARTNARVDEKGLRPDGFAADTIVQSSTGGTGPRLLPFPRGADLPVVVAIRMSLSFPLLLSAVPLYAVDITLMGNQDEKTRMLADMKAGEAPVAVFAASRIWFSDGGIGSNMPLHMFDALLPGHPTFAVNLKKEHPDFPIGEPEIEGDRGGRVFLPEKNNAGRLRHWEAPEDGQPLPGLMGFLVSIMNTMQNWRDEIQFPYPGFRDRIVQISQRADEGGLNLDMPAPVIAALGNAGAMAADRLIDRFHPSGTQAGEGWTNHQTVRLGTFLGTMQPGSAALSESVQSGHWTSLLDRINFTRDERELASEFLVQLGALGELGTAEGLSLKEGAMKPLAEIRISPKV